MTIERLYGFLGYDYAGSAAFDSDAHNQERERFARLLAWQTSPTGELIRRLFNQINTFYAERWMLQHLREEPLAVLLELNRLLLFRQGKHIGTRERRIDYGYRVHLDFMDPFRRLKWLTGASANDVRLLLQQWSDTAAACRPRRSCALALAMCLIAIHPFVDANGRLARLTYTWLCERWELRGENWMDEDGTGELLRTGHGIRGTEYLMAQFMIALADGANVIDPGSGGTRSAPDDARMADAIRRHLQSLRMDDEATVFRSPFTNLQAHLESEGHFRATSPRFECLRTLLR